jgi:TPR repeat protein
MSKPRPLADRNRLRHWLLSLCVAVMAVAPWADLAGAQKATDKAATGKATDKAADKAEAKNGSESPPDETYAAYQRGYFLSAFKRATEQAKNGDTKAMTLLGELYAKGQGVGRDDQKADEWYKLAAGRGDADAMYALGTFRLDGRAGPRDRTEAMKLFAQAAKLGNASAAYNMSLANLEPQGDLKAAADYLKIGAKAGLPDAEYALSLMYKEGRGVDKNMKEAMRLLQRAAIADHPDAMVEFAIAQFNGADTPRNESAAIAMLRRAAAMASPIAQNRLAHVYRMGRGIKADPVQAIRWHLAARAGGLGDPALDDFAARQTPEVRAEAEKAAAPWIEYYKNAPRRSERP